MMLELTAAYTEPHRYYHTLRHIYEMFAALHATGFSLSTEQMLAVWFHDVVYDPQRKDNEERSAEKMLELVSDYDRVCPTEDIAMVEQIILDTKDHAPAMDESRPVLDADMCILGSSWDRYVEYTRQIGAEYSFLSLEEGLVLRKTFLRRWLGFQTLFQTPEFRILYEKRARQNLQAELGHLEMQRRPL